MEISIFWFRRDLRLNDNKGLFYCLKENSNVVPIFIFDVHILKSLPKEDKRVNLIFDVIIQMKSTLEKNHSSFLILYGDPVEVHQNLIQNFKIKNLYFNQDFEPYYPITRDDTIIELYKKHSIPVYTFVDHVFFKPQEILNSKGTPFVVYSQYKKQWWKEFHQKEIEFYKSEDYIHNFIKNKDIFNNHKTWLNVFSKHQNIYKNLEILHDGRFPEPELEKFKFKKVSYILKPLYTEEEVITQYQNRRDYPYIQKGTTNASVYLRFGLVSVRKMLSIAKELSKKLLEELIWREFYIMILFYFPKKQHSEWNPKYEYLSQIWRNPEKDQQAQRDFEIWKSGKTGFPLVDAGMRELSETGYIHNRVRMNCASFLVKNLLIDWRFGEKYFSLKLMDFELASNVGNWQWVAGTGVDASPYFRIFNPILQQIKFDPNFEYIKQWVPEWNTKEYPKPMIDLVKSKKNVLSIFNKN